MKHGRTTVPRVLIADDQPDVLQALRLLFKGEGYQTETVSSPGAVLKRLAEQDFDVLMMDLNYARDTTSGKEGLDLLDRVRTVDDRLPIVVMTAWSNVGLVVEAMRRGARDFVQKPWENDRMVAIIRNQIELGQALRQEQRLEAENRLLRDQNRPELISESPAMRPVLELIERVGPSDANVLIVGANGTGKSLVAHALHAVSPRADGPLVTVNMGGLSETLFETELFGHVKGAFTDAKSDRSGRFELAEGGTLFLDEVANIPLNHQSKLLRVLETGEYERVGSSRTRTANAKIISATNSDLNAAVKTGRFRQDLLFRLNTIAIHLPPLRERGGDIPLLAQHFLRLHAKRYRKQIVGFNPDAAEALQDHAWPGNVRELDHVIERAVLMAQGGVLRKPDLGLQPDAGGAPHLDDMSLEDVERYLIRKTLARCEGNARKAAEALGLSRSAFYRRLEKYGL